MVASTMDCWTFNSLYVEVEEIKAKQNKRSLWQMDIRIT